LEAKLEELKDENISVEDDDEDIQQENMDNLENKISKTEEKIAELKKSITDEIEPYLPDSFTCSCQIPYSWKLPLIKNSD